MVLLATLLIACAWYSDRPLPAAIECYDVRHPRWPCPYVKTTVR